MAINATNMLQLYTSYFNLSKLQFGIISTNFEGPVIYQIQKGPWP